MRSTAIICVLASVLLAVHAAPIAVAGKDSLQDDTPSASDQDSILDSTYTSDNKRAEAGTHALKRPVRLAGNAMIKARLAGNVMIKARLAGNAMTKARLAGNAVTKVRLAGNVMTKARLAGNAVIKARLAGNVVIKARPGGDVAFDPLRQNLERISRSPVVVLDKACNPNTNAGALPLFLCLLRT
ncbi:hypothetical protein C0993_009330 [Termitomyces sp. T159_Od127]|nr:hypothetical protein C0993_009330 [Termitomyces sp. T159_Od127]